MPPEAMAIFERAEPSSPSWGGEWIEETIETDHKKSASRKLAPNLTRRSHKKSRAGCYTCKSRKIKCGEEKPACRHCIIKSAECVYPSTNVRRDTIHNNTKRSSSISSSVSGTSDMFSLQDMQFFHHFLTSAYPHLPLGNDSVWLRDIPQFAQEHSYLMHAMLALGASHYGRAISTGRFDSVALMHRGHAIAGLNQALAKSDHAYGEADAMLAACYALTFQASYMTDGMADFLTFVRGCALAIGKIREEGARTAFDLRPNRHFDLVTPRLQRMPQICPILILEGLEGLDGLPQYLLKPAELGFHAAMRNVFATLRKDTPTGYINFILIYHVWHNLSHEDFTAFLDPKNVTAQILLAYFLGMQLLMVPLTSYEWPQRSVLAPEQTLIGIAGWYREIAKRIPDDLQHHLVWPQSIVETCMAEINGLPFDGPSVLMLDNKHKLREEYD